MLSRSLRVFLFVFAIDCGLFALKAGEKFEFATQAGESISGELIGVYNGIVYIDRGRGKTSTAAYRNLDEPSRALVDEWFKSYVAGKAKGSAKVSESDSKLSAFLANQLQVWRDGELVDYEFAGKAEPEFYAFYYSAHWCGPCRRFTPKLKAFYNAMKALGRDNFEIVFVSSDTSSRMMRQYMQEDEMPWPAVKYNKRSHGLVSKYKGNGIPCLVITDKYGNLLAHSYSGDEYLGPDAPKAQLEMLLQYTATLASKLEKANKD